jgi:NitT/TauT family transport system substrate-binding protein
MSPTKEEAVKGFAASSYNLKFLKEKPDFTALIDKQFIQ